MSTKDNPADQLTRGIPTEKLKESSLWWHGPQWLPHRDKWPEDMKFGKIDNCSEKATILTINPQPIKLMEWERFGSYDKGMRVLAWILRFKNNLSAKISDSAVTTNSRLNVKELRAAEFELYKLVQKESYPQEYKVLMKKDDKNFYTNLMLQLGLYMEHGVIKCRGRLQLATFQDMLKYPILLSGKHHVTRLLIQRCHALNHHFGTNHTVSYMRQKWWIPKLRQVAKQVLRVCKICKKHQGSHYSPVNSLPLPAFRITKSDPFQITGLDYTGALRVKGTANEIKKAYIVLFTCATTRAIHLEIVEDLTGQSFLYAFR